MSFYGLPVIWFGERPFYRLSPAVYRWLGMAGEQLGELLESQLASGALTTQQANDQARYYVERMNEVGRFVERVFAREAVAAARPGLPNEVPPPLP